MRRYSSRKPSAHTLRRRNLAENDGSAGSQLHSLRRQAPYLEAVATTIPVLHPAYRRQVPALHLSQFHGPVPGSTLPHL